MAYYAIDIIDDGRVTIAVEGEFADEVEATHWCYFWLGWYRGDAAKLSRADDRIGCAIVDDPVKVELCEVWPPRWLHGRFHGYHFAKHAQRWQLRKTTPPDGHTGEE